MRKSHVKKRNANYQMTNINTIEYPRIGLCDDGLRILARIIARHHMGRLIELEMEKWSSNGSKNLGQL